tara:strand:+ start:404 stop:1264 length:861 start_codon:yes stop_codon:yes gene_type:complete
LIINFPKLEPALYLVSTPIGTLSDFTFRAINVLQNVNVLLAEDTRVLRKLMNLMDIDLNGRNISSYNDNSGDEVRSKYILELEQNKSIALCCDSGTPLISDPGYKLVRQVIRDGYKVISIPGACSVIVALCQSGLPSDKFFFGGFPPAKKNQRINFFNNLLSVPSTLIFFESPKRILNTLEDLGNIFGNSQQIVVCRELTKNFEENKRGTIDSIIKILRKENNFRGEFTVVVNRKENIKPDLNLIKSDLIYLLKKNTFRDSVAIVSKKYSLSKKEVYNLGLKILNS